MKNEEAPKMNGIHVDEFDDQDEEENKGLKNLLIYFLCYFSLGI